MTGRLTADQIAAAQREMSALKVHQRDALPNATALASADALHIELVGMERAILAEAIAKLHAALETQEPKLIERIRDELNDLVRRLRRS